MQSGYELTKQLVIKSGKKNQMDLGAHFGALQVLSPAKGVVGCHCRRREAPSLGALTMPLQRR